MFQGIQMVLGRFREHLKFQEVSGCFQGNSRNISEGFKMLQGFLRDFVGFRGFQWPFKKMSRSFDRGIKVFCVSQMVSLGFM